jgi:hypothetical protein
VAGLAGTVALTLLAGTVTSSLFALQADRRATAEQTERERAQAAEANLERAVARGRVRPMNPNVIRDNPLSSMELEALWELAETTERPQRLRFLAEMLGTEASASKLRNRMDWVVHSAVGLDPQLREQTEQLLMQSMQDPHKSLRYRALIASALLGVVEAGSEDQRACVALIGQSWAAEEEEGFRAVWRVFRLRQAEGMIPAEAVWSLAQVLEKERDDEARENLAKALASVAGRLEPAEAAHVLAQALDKESRSVARESLAGGLASVAGRLEPAEALILLVRALEKERDGKAGRTLAEGLASVSSRLEPAEAPRVCGPAAHLLAQALETEAHIYSRRCLAEGLASVAARLEPTEAAHLGADVARMLSHRLERDASYFFILVDPWAELEFDGEAVRVARLIQQLDGDGIEAAVLAFARHISSAIDNASKRPEKARAWALENLLTDATRLKVRRRVVALTAALGTGSGGPLAALPLLPAAHEPLPCRLSTQDLVELLKMPTCVG